MASTTPIYEIVLQPSDVPGAIFDYSDVQQHSVLQLKRWLECRGLPVSGNKSELVDRCNQSILNGSDGNIIISIDNGKWYEKKVQGVLASLKSSTVNTPVPPPITGWKQFPSGTIPTGFTYGDIYNYIIASARMTPVPGSKDDGGDDGSFSTSKPMKKGRDFFKSGHIQNIQTVSKHNNYYLKSECLPSYKQNIVYHVHVTLDNFGSVQDASCDCVGSATGRCSHVAALLFALEDYVITFGCQPPSCTSRLCAWNKPRNRKRNPQPAQESQYSKKRAPNRVIIHDPCPVLNQSSGTNNNMTNDSFATSFIASALSLQDDTCWHSILEVPYKDYDLTNDLKLYLLSKYDIFIKNTLENISELGSGPCQCPGTLGQASSDEWHSCRWSRITASICKKASSVHTGRGKYNLLADHFWGLNKVNTSAMQYGCRNETNAFEEYQIMYSDRCKCFKSGFWVNSRYPELGCSPDGLITSLHNEGDGLLEIKCPALLENFHPLEVKQNLTKKQYQSFCCFEENGKLKLKQNHEYYYQCQMQMAVCERKYCDFVIWSPKGMCIERIYYNKLFFEKHYAALQKLYKHVIVPELFEMRVPRKLLPFDLSD